MVYTNLQPNPCDIATQQMWFVPDHRIRSKSAAETAERVVAWIKTGEGLDEKPDEQVLFRALHTCAWRTTRQPRKVKVSCQERRLWAKRWRTIREHLVKANLGLVFMLLTRFPSPQAFEDDMRSDALMALGRAVERFNPWRGIKFSTFACNVIVRDLVRRSRSTGRHQRLFPTQHESWHESPIESADPLQALRTDRLRRAINHNLAELSDLETAIIAQRFPRDHGERQTLQELGNTLGMSKERVRQIEMRAIDKLRDVLDEDPVLQV